MLITRAPRSTAQWIAFASASTEIVPLSATTFATSSSAPGASPAIPMLFSGSAPMIPATIVPCPRVSCALPPTKLLAAAIFGTRSGCERSMPESITATRTGASGGSWSQASNACVASMYHWRTASGSVGANASRRTTAGSTQATPSSPRSCAGAASTERARRPSSTSARWPVTPSTAAATTCGSAPGAMPTCTRPATAGAGSASATSAPSSPRRARGLTPRSGTRA